VAHGPSHRSDTVSGVLELLGRFIVQLPVLAVLVTGLVLVGVRRARLGPRVGHLALAGLGVLALQAALSLAWSLAFPYLVSARTGADYSIRELGVLSGLVSIILGLFFIAGVGLLIAAVLARATPPVDRYGMMPPASVDRYGMMPPASAPPTSAPPADSVAG
jgi:hypothetical protein